MVTLRKRRGKVPAALYGDIMAALESGLGKAHSKAAAANVISSERKGEPAWLIEARVHMGTKEVRGSRHNAKIISWVKKLGGWFTDDETPWCGTFVAYCMKMAGYQPTKHWYRAKDWQNFGLSCQPKVGAIAIFGRKGGGHVGFVVGQSGKNLYILGGNQSNAVNIMPLAKSRCIGFRWPTGLAQPDSPLPRMSGGTVSRNEA